jgi:hypothetical protein
MTNPVPEMADCRSCRSLSKYKGVSYCYDIREGFPCTNGSRYQPIYHAEPIRLYTITSEHKT